LSNRYEVQLTDIALKNLMKYPKKDQKLIMIKIDESKLQDYLDYLQITILLTSINMSTDESTL
jgi:hypothetical protein